MSKKNQAIFAFGFGCVFVFVLLCLAVLIPNPTAFQYQTFRIVMALAAAGIAAMVPGFLKIEIRPAVQLAIRAGGALGVFVVVYFFNPANLIRQPPDHTATPISQTMVGSPNGMQAGRDININAAPSPATTGELKPRQQEPIKKDEGAGIAFDGENSTMEFHAPFGVALFPLGKNVPFWISKDRNGLLINAEVRSLDGKIVAELANNEWRVNPHNYFKLNSDESGLEIIDDYNIPWLQIDYLTPSSLKIGGVFRVGEEDIDSKMFPGFTNSAPAMEVMQIGAGGIIIIGDGTTIACSGTPIESEAEKQAFASKVREIIAPWFDYTPSKGLGVRIPPDPKVTTDPSTIIIPSSNVSGAVEGTSFSCDKAILKILGKSLILCEGTNAQNQIETHLDLKWKMDTNGNLTLPINQNIPVTGVSLLWNHDGQAKYDSLRTNSVVSVQFGAISSNHMLGKFYLESTRKQQTKVLGSFNAEIQFY